MSIEFYSCPPSAPARMVLLLAKHLGVELKVTDIDLSKQEQLKPEFIAINPQHTVPTMVDGDFTLTESRAMMMYLQNKYGKEESLYPKDPKGRALVDLRIFFDATNLYPRFAEAYYPVMFEKLALDSAKVEKLDAALGHTERFLKDGFIAGSNLTIADFSMAAILSTVAAFNHDMSKFPKVTAYLDKCKSTMKGWEELNQAGADMFGSWYKGALAEASG